jgi:hypothetical protein
VVGATLVGAIVVGVVNQVISSLIQTPFVHQNQISLTGWLAVYVVGAIVGGVLLGPFSIAVNTVLYYDLRFRKEGFDPWLSYSGPADGLQEMPLHQEPVAPPGEPHAGPPGEPHAAPPGEPHAAPPGEPHAAPPDPSETARSPERTFGPGDVGTPGGPPYWPPPSGWRPGA